MKINSDNIMCIIALCAILSPILVAIINNRYQYKIKKYETYELKQRQVLENFTKTAGIHLAFLTNETRADFISSVYSLIPYFDISKNRIEDLIDDCMTEADLMFDLESIIPRLSQQIKPKDKLLIVRIGNTKSHK